MERCHQCGFVYDSVPPSAVPEELRPLPPRYTVALRTADQEALARTRPQPRTWSALEYTCHVRDVLRIQRERLQLALRQERPVFAPMRRDERAIQERYNDQPVDTVLDQLTDAAERFASALERLDADQWQRSATYPWPEETERSLAWVARHTLHEGRHHLQDISTGLDTLREDQP